MRVTLAGMRTSVRPVVAKASLPMYCSPSGSSADRSRIQREKAESPMLRSPARMVTVSNRLQPVNARLPMRCRPSGSSIPRRLKQSAKASSAISVTPSATRTYSAGAGPLRRAASSAVSTVLPFPSTSGLSGESPAAAETAGVSAAHSSSTSRAAKHKRVRLFFFIRLLLSVRGKGGRHPAVTAPSRFYTQASETRLIAFSPRLPRQALPRLPRRALPRLPRQALPRLPRQALPRSSRRAPPLWPREPPSARFRRPRP